MVRVLLTGSEGFTGRYLLGALERRGHTVSELAARLQDVEAVRREVLAIGPDAVIHLAGVAFVAHSDARAFYDVNVIGTMNLLDALLELERPLRRVLLASSANVYGPGDGSLLNEDVALNPTNHYAVSKVSMEKMAFTYASRLPIILTRPFNYTGVGQRPDFIVPKIVAAYRRGDRSIRLGRTDVRRDFSDVRAIVAAYCGLLEAEVGDLRTFNLCSARTYSIDDVLSVCGRITSRDVSVERDPAFMRRGEIEVLQGNNERLRSVLPNWRPIEFEETLSTMLLS